jgi:signal transduction histidine kinase
MPDNDGAMARPPPLTIRQLMLIAFAMLVGVLVIQLVASLISIEALSSRHQLLADRVLPQVLETQAIATTAERLSTQARRLAEVETAGERSTVMEGVMVSTATIASAIDRARAGLATDAATALDQARDTLEARIALLDRITAERAVLRGDQTRRRLRIQALPAQAGSAGPIVRSVLLAATRARSQTEVAAHQAALLAIDGGVAPELLAEARAAIALARTLVDLDSRVSNVATQVVATTDQFRSIASAVLADAEVRLDDQLATINQARIHLLVVTAAVAAVAILGTFALMALLHRRVGARIQRLHRAMVDWDRGQADDLRLDGRDELAEMSQALRDLVAALQQSLASAQAASAAKTTFLANMSHELRTPLNAIIGLSDVLTATARDRLDADEQGYIADIHRAGTQMLALVVDLMRVANTEPSTTSAPLQALLGEAVAAVRAEAGSRGVGFAMPPPQVLPPIAGSSEAVRHALTHVLSYATDGAAPGSQIALSLMIDGAGVALAITGVQVGDRTPISVSLAQILIEAQGGRMQCAAGEILVWVPSAVCEDPVDRRGR